MKQALLKKSQPTYPIALLNGKFEVSEAKELVLLFYKETINFYKLRQLKLWVQNHKSDTNIIDQEITNLEAQKNELLMKINQAESLNLMVDFNNSVVKN